MMMKFEKVDTTIKHLKCGKAYGTNKVLPELFILFGVLAKDG